MKRKEIVRQQDLKDCGACSLLSVIRHYDGDISLEQIRVDTHTSLEGTTAYHLVEAAKSYGFDSYGLKLESIDELKDCLLPLIVHVENNHLSHFMVLEKVEKNKIILMDPAEGKRIMSFQEFLKIWTKNIIILCPKYKLPQITNQNIFSQFLSLFFKSEKKTINYFLLLTILFNIMAIISSFYFKVLANVLEDYNNLNIIKTFIFLFIFIYIIKFSSFYLRGHFKTILNKNIDAFVEKHFLDHLFMLPNYFIKNRTTGEIMTRLSELKNFKYVFSEIITILLIDIPLSLGVSIILYNMSKNLFLITCFFVGIYLLNGIIGSKTIYKKVWRVNELEVNLNSKIIENLDLFTTIKNLNITKNTRKKIEVNLVKYLKSFFSLNTHMLHFETRGFVIEEILNFILLSVGIVEIFKGNLSLINLITFSYLISYFITPFKSFISLIPSYESVKINLEKLREFYTIEEETVKDGYNDFKNGDIKVNNLNYSYNLITPIFRNLNLEIKENSFVLFHGFSGCGKSTLCQMLCGLITDKTSSIKIGDTNLNDYSLAAIRKNITYVGQKESLIQDTIKNNILLGRNIKEEDFKKVVKICKLEQVVRNKPLRYETYLFKDSQNLSGGEKQRIILARALLNDFNILILDESLSEVNEDLEMDIINELKTHYQNKTIIYVSHKKYKKIFDSVYNFGELV